MAIDPISIRWTLHALGKAQQLGFARRDVESALLEHHRERQRNPGRAEGYDPSTAVAEATDAGLRELDPSTGEIVGLEFCEASSRLPADFLRMLPPPQVEIAA